MLLGLLALLLSTASVAGAAPFAYVSYSNTAGGRVAVIDASPTAACANPTETGPCVVKTLIVGSSPVGVAVNPAGTFAYVANAGDDSVSVIRTANNPSDIAVVATIQDHTNLFGPWGVAVSPDSTKVYVGLSNGFVAMIDSGNFDPASVVRIPAGGGLGMLNGIVAVGSRVFVADATNSQVVVIDGPTKSVVGAITVGSPPNSNPMGLVVNPSGTRVYVADARFDDTFLIDVFEVSGIDTSLLQVVESFVVDPFPLNGSSDNTAATPGGIALSPDGRLLYVANDGLATFDPVTSKMLNDVTIITLSNGSRAHVTVGTSPVGVATDPTGRTYVANRDGGTVSVLDPTTNAVVKTIGLAGGLPSVFGAFATAGPPQFALTLTTVGGGSIQPQPASATGSYDAGSVVTLTAMPDASSQFTGWSGDCSGTSVTCTVTMNAAKSVTATFTPLYSLFVTTLGSGTVSASPTSATSKYLAGTSVTLTATADPNFVFTGWSGACSGTATTCTLTMDAAKSATATFTAQYSLFVTSLGNGTVSASPTSATSKYLAGTVVTLTATAGSDSQFSSWSGACSGTATTCDVTMDAAKSVTATFALKQFALTLTPVGPGTISAQPTSANNTYNVGTVVTLTATPAANAQFSGWSGACSGTAATCAVTMNAAQSVTATFALRQFALSVTPVGPGTVSVQPSAANNLYNAGTVVTLTAAPAANAQFSGWSGACSGTAATCAVTMNAAQSVTATFALKQFQLSLTAVGTGTISAQPSAANNVYTAGTVVGLTAAPGPGYQLSGWSGACSGTATTCSVTMDAAKSVTATFSAQQFVLTLTTVGDGSIAANPGPTGGMYPFGTPVTLTATPSGTVTTTAATARTAVSTADSKFAGWSGACAAAGTNTTCTLTMDSAKSVTATFTATAPPPTTCEDVIKDLEKKVAASKHPWAHNHQLRAALKQYHESTDLLARAKAKVGERDKRYVHAKQQFDNGKSALCHDHYWRAHHEFWETEVISREILKQRR
jgi:uncharacterized repeat protein (TIGR02543 family)